jgi:hypothetical protein
MVCSWARNWIERNGRIAVAITATIGASHDHPEGSAKAFDIPHPPHKKHNSVARERNKKNG